MTAISLLDLQALAQVPAARLANTAIQGFAIAFLTWLLLRFTAKNSGTRFAAWLFALLTIAVLPFLGDAKSRSAIHSTSAFTISGAWAVYVLAIWATISSLFLLRLALGLWKIYQLRQTCREVELESIDPLLRTVMQRYSGMRQVRLCISDEVKAPAAMGFVRPAIVLPAWVLNEFTVDELKVTMLHELAHLRRWDDWTNLVQKVVKALFFFHPAVWWIEGKLALEREMACDDLVLEQTANPKAYAASLISFAERIHRGRELALLNAVVGRVRQISQRVTRILDGKRRSDNAMWKPISGLVTVLSGAALIAGSYTPQLVAFRDIDEPEAIAVKRDVPRTSTTPVALGSKTEEKKAQPIVVPAKLKVRKPTLKPRVVLAKTVPEDVLAPDMTLMMRSVQYDATGAPVWALSVWRVTTGERVETMFVVSKI